MVLNAKIPVIMSILNYFSVQHNIPRPSSTFIGEIATREATRERQRTSQKTQQPGKRRCHTHFTEMDREKIGKYAAKK